MMLLLFCLALPLALFAWRLCDVAAAADEQTERLWQEMQQREQGRSQDTNGSLLGKEKAHAG